MPVFPGCHQWRDARLFPGRERSTEPVGFCISFISRGVNAGPDAHRATEFVGQRSLRCARSSERRMTHF